MGNRIAELGKWVVIPRSVRVSYCPHTAEVRPHTAASLIPPPEIKNCCTFPLFITPRIRGGRTHFNTHPTAHQPIQPALPPLPVKDVIHESESSLVLLDLLFPNHVEHVVDARRSHSDSASKSMPLQPPRRSAPTSKKTSPQAPRHTPPPRRWAATPLSSVARVDSRFSEIRSHRRVRTPSKPVLIPFRRSTCGVTFFLRRQRLWSHFLMVDADHSGQISLSELRKRCIGFLVRGGTPR